MDHFFINQICTNCWKGNQIFKVNLSLYDQHGKLRIGIDEIEQFCFICVYCWRTTRLDFYTFSHPSIILHLKHLEKLHEQQLDAINKQLDAINKLKAAFQCGKTR